MDGWETGLVARAEEFMTQHALRLLLVNQERPLKVLLERELPASGPLAVAFQTGEEARELLHQRPFDITQLDFEVPEVGRVETRRRFSQGQSSDIVVVESRARTGAQSFVADLLASAPEDNFLTLPLTATDLESIVQEAAALARTGASTLVDWAEPGDPVVVSRSPAMQDLLTVVKRVAAGAASVLLQGETGTGKTLIARRIHELSPRGRQALVAINCGAFQDQLLESELFGHEKGAFTGAIKTKPGLFEVAHQGTIFLDEIAEMTSSMQAKLLQVLDAGELRRVGGTETRKVDVRVIAATNKDLHQEVRSGRFREDLFFRLNVIQLKVPPLRQRPEDVTALISHFLERFRLPGQLAKSIAPEVLQVLLAYSWPGNVRELANVIEGLILLAPGNEIRGKDLPPHLRPVGGLETGSADAPLPLAEMERLHIVRTLRFTDGKKAPAARLLDIDIKTLSNKLKSYGIAE